MPRLIRIALTLFLAATILTIMAGMRADRAQEYQTLGMDEEISELASNEAQMVMVGTILATVMVIAGLGLVVAEIVRRRNRSRTNDDQ